MQFFAFWGSYGFWYCFHEFNEIKFCFNYLAEISRKFSADRWFNKTEDCIFPRSFILRGSQCGDPFDGWRLKISHFDGWRLNFTSFDGWRLVFQNDVYRTNLSTNLTVSFKKTICYFLYLNTGFNPIICALKMRLLVINYGNYVYY